MIRLESLVLAGVQQVLQILLPYRCPGMRAVAMGLVGDGNQDEPSFFHALDFAFGNAEFRRVDKIVG